MEDVFKALFVVYIVFLQFVQINKTIELKTGLLKISKAKL